MQSPASTSRSPPPQPSINAAQHPSAPPPPAPAGSYPPFVDPSITSRRPTRVIMHCDMDAYYSQVESQRHPHFLHHALGVIQNGTLCVTTNYHCRGRGLPKMGAPADFAALCPSMKFAGSDMVRYRRASRQWHRSFCSWKGVVVMKRSIDEAYLDLTAAVRQRIKARQLLTPVPHSSPADLEQIAKERHDRAIAAYRADEAALIERYGPLEPHLLESSGTIKAAVRASKSTDPITQLREQQRGGGFNWEENSRKGMTIDEKVKAMSEEQIVAMLEQLHPTDYCRAQKKQVKPIELVSAEEAETRQAEVAAAEGLRWRPWVGEVLLSGEEDGSLPAAVTEPLYEEDEEEALNDEETQPSPPLPASSPPQPTPPLPSLAESAPTVAPPSPLAPPPTFLPPPTDFSLEDPLNPSDDYLLCVGSQLAWEIRSTLYYQMGLTTSAGIAPNMMLAKLASSHNKPNQQSIVRRSIARDFISPFKLSKVSGFGPKANERVLAAGVVTVSQVQARTYASLVLEFGEKFGSWLYSIGQAEDETPVEVTGPPKSIGQSKRQKTQTEDERLNLLYWLASKLYERIEEDEREYHRFPTTLALGFIFMGTWDIQSRRQQLVYLRGKTDPVQLMYEMAIQLLKDNVPAGVPLRCLSLTVSNFVPLPGAKAISSYFSKGADERQQDDSKESAVGQTAAEAVPLTAHPTIGPSFTFRYKEAKAKVKEKVGGGRRAVNLFVEKEKVRRIDHMPLTKLAPQSTQLLTEDEVCVQERKTGETTGSPVVARNGSEEDEINALFGAGDDTSLDSAPPSLSPDSALSTNPVPLVPSPPRSHGSPMIASPVASVSPASTTAPSALPPVQPAATYVCDVCTVGVPESERIEHTDYHYAQQLQATVRADDRRRREEEADSRRRQKKGKPPASKSGAVLERYVRQSSALPMPAQRRGSDDAARARDIGSFFHASPTCE